MLFSIATIEAYEEKLQEWGNIDQNVNTVNGRLYFETLFRQWFDFAKETDRLPDPLFQERILHFLYWIKHMLKQAIPKSKHLHPLKLAIRSKTHAFWLKTLVVRRYLLTFIICRSKPAIARILLQLSRLFWKVWIALMTAE